MSVFELEIAILPAPTGAVNSVKERVINWIAKHTDHEIVETLAVGNEPPDSTEALFQGGNHCLVIYAQSKVELTTLQPILLNAFPNHIAVRIIELPSQAWQNAWEERATSFVTQNFHVVLDADPVQLRPSKIPIYLSTTEAFGNGQHATTKACLEIIEKIYPESKWKSALDLGTGSGILAIALAKLGCKRVVGTEIADELVKTAQDNARRNAVKGEWVNIASPVLAWQAFDVIVANILIPVLYDLLPACRQLLQPQGSLILAGFIEKELVDLSRHAELQGLQLADRVEVRGWLATRWTIRQETQK